MKELLSNPTITTILIVICTVLIVGMQYVFGYKKWKLLAFVFPLVHIGFVVYCFLQGVLTLSVRDILMPIIGLLVLSISYERGYNSAKHKQDKELEKMRAQDNLS